MLSSTYGQKGCFWKNLHIKRASQKTIERLKKITIDQLHKTLGVVAQYKIDDTLLIPKPLGPNLNKGELFRKNGKVIQYGLKANEIEGIYKRLQRILAKVDKGRILIF